MGTNITLKKQDMTFLNWSYVRSSSGTAGSFLKSESVIDGVKKYYKLSNYNPIEGVVGHECINEIIVDRLLTLLGIEHLNYELIYADIDIDDIVCSTYLCASEDFKEKGESKIALDDFYRINSLSGESRYDFCVRYGFREYIDAMLVVDYLILNRDRHGANIEVLRDANAHTFRIAPLFDHGVSLLYSCHSDEEIARFDILEDKRCQNFIGGYSCLDNLKLIGDKPFTNRLDSDDKDYIFEGLTDMMTPVHIDAVWKMIYERYQIYENL